MEADFGDGDVIESDIKDCESLVQLGFHLLAEMAISSSPEVTSDMIKPVFELATVHFLKLADVEKINAQPLHHFMSGTLFPVLKIVLAESMDSLRADLVLEALSLIQNVAKQTLRPALRASAKFSFYPEMCSLILASMTQLVRHVAASNAASDDEDHNNCLNNFVSLLQGLVRTQSVLSYQLYSLDLETQLVNLIGRITRVDPTGKWAKWSGTFHNCCSSGKAFPEFFKFEFLGFIAGLWPVMCLDLDSKLTCHFSVSNIV